MPRGFSENQTQQIREKLISSAFDAVPRTGVRKTTVEDLAKSAGISTGAFYKFFPTKETLFFVVYDRLEEGLKTEFTQFLESSARLSAASIGAYIKGILRSEPMQILLRFLQKEDMEYMLRGVAPECVEDHLQKDVSFMREVIHQCGVRGVQVTDNEALILAYLQALFVLCATRDQYGAYSDSIVDTFVDAFIGKITA